MDRGLEASWEWIVTDRGAGAKTASRQRHAADPAPPELSFNASVVSTK
jgi:hypothetical protein